MGLFSSKKIDERLNVLDKNLADSFAKVKQDRDLIFEWITYLYEVVQQQQRALHDISSAIERVPKGSEIAEIRDEIQRILNDSSKMRSLAFKMAEIEQNLEKLALKDNLIKEIRQEKREISPKTHLKERVVKRIARSSKDYIKHTINSLIAKYGKISALELRDILIDEQKLCSKSTFYRLLEELEEDDESITVVKDKKTKAYMQKFAEKSTWK